MNLAGTKDFIKTQLESIALKTTTKHTSPLRVAEHNKHSEAYTNETPGA
jgi:hypothetical protein